MFAMDAMTQQMPSEPLGRLYQHTNIPNVCTSGIGGPNQIFVEIIEQPVSDGARFRYKCEGRSAGCIRGVNSTEKHKTYPTIRVHGYHGAACVVVSCITKDGPPYYPHPHNLVGKTCTNGVCYKPINNSEMICSFSNLGIQCVKRKDIKDSLAQREALQVDPFGTGFSHYSEPNKINLNALRLCFQVFIPDSNGRLCIPLSPVISTPIFDNKTVSDLTITKLSHYSAPVTGGQEIILLCDQVNKDDIQIIFYEENDKEIIWSALGKFSPHHVHRKVAISFQSPAYKNPNMQEKIKCFIHLRRPSDGTVGKPREFTLLPLKKDPEGMVLKRDKFEALRLDRVLQLSNLPAASCVDINARIIKQAVRTKASYQSAAAYPFQPKYVPGNEFNVHDPAAPNLGNVSYTENVPLPLYNSQKAVPTAGAESTVILPNAHQRVDNILAVASAQIGLNAAAQNFCGAPADDTLDRLSSLDLGLNSSDLDVNLSGINIDSFTETVGLNFSLGLMDAKSTDEKMIFQDNLKLLQDGRS